MNLSSFTDPVFIRTVPIVPGLVLAPMSGVTCSAFRRLIKELNPDAVGLVVSEFVSVEGMTRHSAKTLEMMRFRPEERPFGIQIFGYDPARMADAAKMVEDRGADILDINCGCPAPKVVKRGGGCELMRQPEHVASVFRAVRRAVQIPVTMKMRSGWDENNRNAVEIALVAWREGIEGITVHGRTRAQLYRGAADWNIVAEVAHAVPLPVFGSGDVVDRSSALMRATYGVAGVYVGRAAMENPLVFSEIQSGQSGTLRKDRARCARILLRYMDLLAEDLPEKAIGGKIKQLASQMARGHLFRKELLTLMEVPRMRTLLERASEAGGSRELPATASRGCSSEVSQATMVDFL